MSTKTINAKTFVKDAGTKNQLFVFAGYNPNSILSDANETSINLWNYSVTRSFRPYYHITDRSVHHIVADYYSQIIEKHL